MSSRYFSLGVLWVLIGLSVAVPQPALAAKDYRADRFDVSVVVEPGGSLLVTETVLFVFGDDTFSYVARGLSTRRTDGLSVIAASMDGRPFTPGDEPGQFEFKRADQGERRVIWHFEKLTNSTHTFVLTYRAAGVVRPAPDADLLEWRALPTRHPYRIGCASLELTFPPPATLVGAVVVDPSASSSRTTSGAPLRFERCGFEPDDSWVLRASFAGGSVTTTMPGWQRRATQARQRMPIFLGLAAMIALLGLGGFAVFGLNHRSSMRADGESRQVEPPDALPAVLAAVLAKSGSVKWDAALATILDLARREVVDIEEQAPGGLFSTRDFRITARGNHRSLRPFEQVLYDLLFTTNAGPRPSVTFSELGKIFGSSSRWKQFAAAVTSDLRIAGVYDPERERARHAATRVAVAIVVLAIVGLIATVPFIDENGGASLIMAVAALVVGLVGIGVAQSLTPFTEGAVQRAHQWQAYHRHLTSLSKEGPPSSAAPAAFERVLPYAAAFGVALAWTKTLQKHGMTAGPPWLRALTREGATAGNMDAMVAMLTAAQSHAHAVNHAAAGSAAAGVAGGGSSSAG
jgi:hypothetical protein